jgi:formylglycine-generating enzyme required for sulfatase activity/pimeloyl-ACP methyl ester carboxylesterase
VFWEPYAANTDQWERLGRTPIARVRLPRGAFRFRIEKNGYATRIVASTNPGVFVGNLARPGEKPTPLALPLAPASEPAGMVQVPGEAFPVSLSGFNTNETVRLADYAIDRYEVTNEAYKKFVDAGGYAKADNWTGAPVAEFVDSTGRPGPSTWELGRFPAGQGDFPVSGVNWYEANAYCRAQGTSLPTLYHWARAAMSPVEIVSPLAPAMIPLSNFSKKGPARVGEYRGLGPYGTFDMGGNVREWVWNEAERGRRGILGGSWNDETWMMVVPNSLPPLDRSPKNGFRCARLGTAPLAASLTGAIEIHRPNVAKAVSNEVFDVFKRQLAYVKGPVDLRVESRDASQPDWIRERISVGAAGSDTDRAPAILFLPRNAAPPYQLAVAFPGLGDFVGRTPSDTIQAGNADFVLKSGRALVYPIWKGSHERWDPFLTLAGDEYFRTFRTRMADWRQELGRLLDALADRQEIDSSRVAYFGVSFGASTMFPLLALEDRFKTAVLAAPGYTYRALPPEADAVNYAPRVTVPVLMLGGRHDYVLPYETSQKPMFADLGTPADRKQHIVFDAGHTDFPRSDFIRDVLGWLDRYLGPVQAK